MDGWMDRERKTHLPLFAASVFCVALVAVVLLTSFVCSLGLAPGGQREEPDSMKKNYKKKNEQTKQSGQSQGEFIHWEEEGRGVQ